ncbi:MAG: hypothetical protein FWF82_00955 [Oscillospiraceae bacterium]|nr:hypothetical protein [Oscillospiraceae bacterium]
MDSFNWFAMFSEWHKYLIQLSCPRWASPPSDSFSPQTCFAEFGSFEGFGSFVGGSFNYGSFENFGSFVGGSFNYGSFENFENFGSFSGSFNFGSFDFEKFREIPDCPEFVKEEPLNIFGYGLDLI